MFPQECSHIYPQPSALGKYNYIPSGNIYIFTLWNIHMFPAQQGTYGDMYSWVYI